MDKIEEKFREVASNQIQTASRRFEEGQTNLKYATPEYNVNSKYEPQEHINGAGESFAFSIEHGLKSNIIYDDFRKNELFNQTELTEKQIGNKSIIVPAVGSNEWHNALAGNVPGMKFISSPKDILKNIVLVNNPNDPRANINNEPQYNSQMLSLTFDGKSPSGHSLYAYYQLQSPLAKNLINMEYYCYVEEQEMYTIYALLTDDILKRSSDGKTIVPIDFMENLDSVKEAAVDLRYASISFDNVKPEEIKFLKEFSNSVLNAGEYRFPLPKQYKQMDFEQFNYNNFFAKDYQWFSNLDKIQKYYLQSCFDKNEIKELINYCDQSIKLGISYDDLNIYISSCIYFKNCIKNRIGIDLEFGSKQFERIDNFCRAIKAFQPFSKNSKRLCEDKTIISEEKQIYYINEIKMKKESSFENKNNQPKKSPHETIENYANIIIDFCNEYKKFPTTHGTKEYQGISEKRIYGYYLRHKDKFSEEKREEIEKLRDLYSDKANHKLTQEIIENYADIIIGFCNEYKKFPTMHGELEYQGTSEKTIWIYYRNCKDKFSEEKQKEIRKLKELYQYVINRKKVIEVKNAYDINEFKKKGK